MPIDSAGICFVGTSCLSSWWQEYGKSAADRDNKHCISEAHHLLRQMQQQQQYSSAAAVSTRHEGVTHEVTANNAAA